MPTQHAHPDPASELEHSQDAVPLSLVTRRRSAIGGRTASPNAHWPPRHVGCKVYAAGRRGTMRAVLAACALATCCSGLMYGQRAVENTIDNVRQQGFADQKYDGVFQSLSQKMQDNGDFTDPRRALAYYATESYCCAQTNDENFNSYRDILKHLIYAFPEDVFENGAGDTKQAVEVLLNCYNGIADVINVNESFKTLNVYKLSRLPMITKIVMAEDVTDKLAVLAPLQISPLSYAYRVTEDKSVHATPFVTPMLLLDLLWTNQIDFEKLYNMATEDIKQITVSFLHVFQSLENSMISQPNLLTESQHVVESLHQHINDINQVYVNKLQGLNQINNEKYYAPLDVVAERILQLASREDSTVCNLYNSELQFYFFLGSTRYRNAFDSSLLSFFFSLKNNIHDKRQHIQTLLNLLSLPHSLSLQSIYSQAGLNGDFSDFLMHELTAWYSLNEIPIGSMFSNHSCLDSNSEMKYLLGFDNMAQFAFAMNAKTNGSKSYASEAHCVGRHFEYSTEQKLTRYYNVFSCDCLIYDQLGVFEQVETFVSFAQPRCIPIFDWRLGKTESLEEHKDNINLNAALDLQNDILNSLSVKSHIIKSAASDTLKNLHTFLTDSRVQLKWPDEVRKQLGLLPAYVPEQLPVTPSNIPLTETIVDLNQESKEEKSDKPRVSSRNYKILGVIFSVEDIFNLGFLAVAIIGAIVFCVCLYCRQKRKDAEAQSADEAAAAEEGADTAQNEDGGDQEESTAAPCAAEIKAVTEKIAQGRDESPV